MIYRLFSWQHILTAFVQALTLFCLDVNKKQKQNSNNNNNNTHNHWKTLILLSAANPVKSSFSKNCLITFGKV